MLVLIPMITRIRPTPTLTLAAALAASLLLASYSSQAATLSWDADATFNNGTLGGTGTWDLTTANWDNGGADAVWTDTTGTVDLATFAGTAGTVTFNTSLGALGLIFNTTGYTISGTGTLTLGTSGIDASTLSSGTTTISAPITLAGAQSWTTGAGAALSTTGTINNGGFLLTVSGAGSTKASGIISGSGGLTKSGTGTLTLSGVNTFTGATTINAGAVNVTANLNLGTGNGVTLNGGTLNAMNGFTNTHIFTIGASGGTINVGGNATQQVNFSTASTLTGSGTLTVTGSNIGNGNDVRLSAAQTGYTGNIVLQSGGILEFGATNAVNSSATFNVNSGGELVMNNAVTAANVITVANGGILSFENGTTGVFSGSTITLSGGTATVSLRDYYGVNTVRGGTISGKLTGSGALQVNSGGGSGGTLTLTGANDYTGATTVNNSNLTVNGAAGTISGSSGYTLNGSVLTLDNTSGNVDRLKDTAAVSMNSGGGLTLTGNATTNTTETVGALGIGTGNSTLTVGSQTSRVTTLAADSLSRTNNATALIRGTSLNQSATTNVSRITLVDGGASLTQVGTNTLNNGGTADTTQALKIVPYFFGDITTAGTGTNFVTYDSTLGLRVLLAGEQTTLSSGYVTAANPDNAIAFNGTLATTGDVTVNSLLFNVTTQTLDGSGGSLTIASGALASASTAEIIGSGFSSLAFGNGEGVVTVTSGNALTINTPISVTSSGGLTKAGAGTLTLGAANTYTGQTTVNQGTLAITAGVNNVLNGTTGTALQVNNGATFNTNASTQKITTLGLMGNAIVSGTGGVLDLGGTVTYDASTNPGPGATISVATLDLNGTRTFNIGSAPTQWNPFIYNTGGTKQLTVSSAIVNGTGTGGITKNGAGVLVLSGAGASNTYSGATTVNAGTLYFLAALPGAPNSDITVNSGATLAAQMSTQNAATTIGKSLTLNGAQATFGTNDNPNGAAGRQNRYLFTNALTLGSGDNVVAINNTQNGGFGSNVEFASLSRSSGGGTVLFRGHNLGAGALLTNATNDGIRFTTTTPTLTGGGGAIGSTTTSILPYAIGDSGDYQNTFYLTSGLGTDFVTYNGTSVQLLTTYASTITSGASALNNVKVTDTGITGINAATTINSLILTSATATAGLTGASSVDGTGTLTLNSGALLVTTTSAASANGGSNSNYGGLYTNNATIGASGLTLDFGSKEAVITTVGSSTLTIASTSGGITGSGGLTKAGAGTLNLNAANAYTGTTTMNAGSIVLGNSAALQNSTLNYDNQGGTLSFGTLTAATLGSLKGAQNLALTNTSPAAVTLTLGNNNATNDTYSGILSGSGSLIKVGTGIQTLSGINTYTGSTTVNAGTLALGSAGSLASTTYTIANGAIFNASAKTSYDLTGIATTIGVGASTAGRLTGPSGALTFGGTLALNFSTSALTDGQTYTLFSFGSETGNFTSVAATGGITDTFSRSGNVWTNGDQSTWVLSLDQSSGILSVTASAIPEPATYTAIFGVLALAGAGWQRRRRVAVSA
jgi:autotransporter-associated beta strand protein